MKVKELIEKLQALNPELMVVRHGYEGGVEEAAQVESVMIALNVNQEWYYGSHELIYKDDEHPGHEVIEAICIS